MFLYKLITFNFFWTILALFSFTLCFVNLYAFYKCNKDYKNKIQKIMGNQLNMGSIIVAGIKNKIGL